MTTARTIINKSLQKIGVLTKSEAPAADEISDGLDALNALLASWSNESLSVYTRVRESFTLSGGVASYTIGTGQTFNTDRPVFITDAFVRSGDVDYNLSVISDEIYNSSITLKTTSGIPQFLNYNNAYPAGTIYLYPVPASSYELHILSEKELSQYTIDEAISLPTGWERALIYNLAIDLAPEYGQQIDGMIAKIAGDSKAAIQRTVAKNISMDATPSQIGLYNIYSGY